MTLDILSTGNIVEGVEVITTSATPILLDAASLSYLKFVGSESQTVILPNAQTCLNGHHFFIINKSSAVINILYKDNSSFLTINPYKYQNIRLFDNSTSNGVWENSLFGTATGDLNECYALGNTLVTEGGKNFEIAGSGKLKLTNPKGVFTDQIKANGDIIFLGDINNQYFLLDSVGSPTENVSRFNLFIELQLLKENEEQRCSGNLGAIVGGANNASDNGVVLGGKNNQAGERTSCIIAGAQNRAVSSYHGVVAGYDNYASGYNIVLAGKENSSAGSVGGFGHYLGFAGAGSFALGGNSLSQQAQNTVCVGGALYITFYNYYRENCIFLGGVNNTFFSENSIVCGFVGRDTSACDFAIGNNYFITNGIDNNFGPSNGFLASAFTCSVHVGNQGNLLKRPVYITGSNPTVFRSDVLTGHQLYNGLRVVLSTDSMLPAPFTTGQIYYVVNRAYNDYQLSLTKNGPALYTNNPSTSGYHYVEIVQDNRLYLHTTNTNHQSAAVSLAAPNDLTSDVNFILPALNGSTTFLQTNGDENLTWQYQGFSSTTSISGTGDLITQTLPANTLKDGDVIEVSASGINTTTSNITVEFRIGGNVIASVTTTSTYWVLPKTRFIYSSADNKLKTLIYSSVENINFTSTIDNEIKLTQTTAFNITLENIAFKVLRS